MTLDNARYLNLGTFRKTGVRVDTPVWFAPDDDKLFVLSNNAAGKVKRLRNSPRCMVAPCTMLGNPTGEWMESRAYLVEDDDGIRRAYTALKRKYGWQMLLLDSGAWLGGRIRQRTFICIEKP